MASLLILIYTNCNRPPQIHKQIFIEYLDSNEMINSIEKSPPINSQSIPPTSSCNSLRHSNM